MENQDQPLHCREFLWYSLLQSGAELDIHYIESLVALSCIPLVNYSLVVVWHIKVRIDLKFSVLSLRTSKVHCLQVPTLTLYFVVPCLLPWLLMIQ